jgi:hypothetical protein
VECVSRLILQGKEEAHITVDGLKSGKTVTRIISFKSGR